MISQYLPIKMPIYSAFSITLCDYRVAMSWVRLKFGDMPQWYVFAGAMMITIGVLGSPILRQNPYYG
jgi:hypothetical protein